jgi:ectoine hydroxylase-related dioxygenase (phytanoyl-CoA dioxygenase family)
VRPHDLNSDFEWRSAGGPFTIVTPEQARQYDEYGFFVLEDAFDDQVIAEVTTEIDPVEARREEWLRDHGGTFFIARAGEITFSTHLVLESDYLRRFAASPVLAGLCTDLVGPDVRLYWDQAVYKKPHTSSPFPWHQDNGYAFIEPQQYLTCWIPLTDATEDNGCPWVVPGVHRMGTLAHETTAIGLVCLDEAPEAVAVPAKRGSIVVFSSLTPHSTGANVTEDVRKAYIVQYAPAGAEVLAPDGNGSVLRTPAEDPLRQYPVVEGGRPSVA